MFKLLLYMSELVAFLLSMNADPKLVKEDGNYYMYELTDSCTLEVLQYADSALVVETICAPICSSTARVYNKDNKVIRTIRPANAGVFPAAWIENGELHWRDNTDQMLDAEEIKRK